MVGEGGQYRKSDLVVDGLMTSLNEGLLQKSNDGTSVLFEQIYSENYCGPGSFISNPAAKHGE